MHFNVKLIENLSKATSRNSVIRWLFITILYGFAIIANDHFELVKVLGLPGRIEATIRLCGVYLYIVLTGYSFYNTKKYENNINDNKVAADMAHHDQFDNVPFAAGTQSDTQGGPYKLQTGSITPISEDDLAAKHEGDQRDSNVDAVDGGIGKAMP